MTTARITLINDALYRIGADPLDSEDAANAGVYLAVYNNVVEFYAAFPFKSFLTTRKLNRLTAAPSQHWLYAHQLPADRIGAPRGAFPRSDLRVPATAYAYEGDQLLTDYEEIWLQFATLGQPQHWNGDLREAIRRTMMAHFALSVREDRTLYDRLLREAHGTPSENGLGGLFSVALENDGISEPDTQIAGGVNPLIDVRW